VIASPNPAWARTSLSDYLNGFSSQGHSVLGKIGSVFRLSPVSLPPGAAPFTVGSQLSGGAVTASPAGACASVDLLGSTAPGGARFQYCDGAQSGYEVDFAAAKGAVLQDLSGSMVGAPVRIPANAAGSWSIARTSGGLVVSPAVLTISAVTDSAAFAPAISPGSLFTIFGSGFAGTPTVTLAGKPLQILATFPFQINAAIPLNAAVGSAMLQVNGPDGSATASVALLATSPGIFQLGNLGAILNSDATLNAPSNPAQRGQFISVYCTGLGAAANPKVTLLIDGTTVQTSFAGAVTGFTGLYQINATIPPGMPPDLTATLAIRQGVETSNTVPVAIE
ncbi:MAG TPA: hypothetical protein VFC21_02645, partial [Bryobacteraceae bacterium]|nr:hypothetical protein [Bryobacteraceae bacterium]